MPRKINPFGKTRDKDRPYAVYISPNGQWEWRVTKTYKHPDNEVKDPYARWMVWARSPHTYGGYEGGDTYARNNGFDQGLLSMAILVSATQAWIDHQNSGSALNKFGDPVEILED